MNEDGLDIHEDLAAWLEASLEQSYPIAFMLSFDDREASSLVSEAINLFFLRRDSFEELDRFKTKIIFFQCVYRSFIAKKRGFWKPLEHNFERSSLLVQLDPIVRAMIFCKQRLSLDYEDISFIFERDRHQIMNDILVYREKLLTDLRAAALEDM